MGLSFLRGRGRAPEPNSVAARIDRDGDEGVIVLAYLLNLGNAVIRANRDSLLDEETIKAYDSVMEKRRSGMPLQYAIGKWNFYGRDFLTDPRALIPRPETEQLVFEMLEEGADGLRVVDVGTGTGAIALTIAAEARPQMVWGIDLSREALELARENEALGRREGWLSEDNVRWLEGDLLEGFSEPVDVVISNPPYIAAEVRGSLDAQLEYEPEMALYSGHDGLDALRRLIPQAYKALAPGGRFHAEIGYDQRESVAALLREAGFSEIVVRQDANGHDRTARAVKPRA